MEIIMYNNAVTYGKYYIDPGWSMLERKAEQIIADWIRNGKNALLVSGARQVGKTYSIRKCLKELEADYLEINLIKTPKLIEALANAETVDDLKINISASTNYKFTDGKSVIFIDEVQECKEIVTKIKFWVDDGRYRFVLSGSLLGIELNDVRSVPVGYLKEIEMFPLDFEEFLRASGVLEETIDYLKDAFVKETAVSDVVNEKMMSHLYRYLVVGGMPEAVQEYVNSGDIGKVSDIQESIIRTYKRDFTKYERQDKKLMLISVFGQIPSNLLKQNKRFIYSDIKNGLKFERVESSFLWLSSAGVSIPVYNATEPRVSLNQNKKSSLLKLYSSDVGLLTKQYGDSIRYEILVKNPQINLGGIFENFVAQELNSHKFDGYFYNSHKQGELDFVIENEGKVIPIEVKSGKDYYIHSALNNAVQNREYQIEKAYVFADCNTKVDEKIRYMPIYMVSFLTQNVEMPVLKPIE
ncbi:MAG: ATP-binding protein [Lachnospiraceae bacterium]|nr:ATP-binding protein [Lachnospiraceae bacterium]